MKPRSTNYKMWMKKICTYSSVTLVIIFIGLPLTTYACDPEDVVSNGGCSASQYCNANTDTCVNTTNAQGGLNNPSASAGTAQSVPTNNTGNGTAQSVPTNNTSSGAGLINPLNTSTIQGLIQEVLGYVVTIGGIFLMIMLIYVGFMFINARGNEQKLTQARNAFLYTVIGGLILLGASVLASVLASTISSL